MKSLQKYPLLIIVTTIVVFILYGGVCRCQTSFKERISLNIGTGWGNYNMKRGIIERDANDDFVFTEYESKRIEGGMDYYGGMIFDIFPNFSLAGGLAYSVGKQDISEWVWFLDDYYPTPRPDPVIYETSITAPYLNMNYSTALDILRFSLGAGFCYGFGSLYGDVARRIDPASYYFERIHFKSKGVGYTISWGFSIRVMSSISIDNSFSFRHLVTGDLEDPGGNQLENSSLDFSGFLIRGGISINPWGNAK